MLIANTNFSILKSVLLLGSDYSLMLRVLYVDFFIQTLFKTRVCGFNFYISSISSVHASIFSQIRLERIEGPPPSHFILKGLTSNVHVVCSSRALKNKCIHIMTLCTVLLEEAY